MEDSNTKLNDDELNQLNKISWDDIEEDLIKNKEMVRTEKVDSKYNSGEHKSINTHAAGMESILDIPLELTVEVGRKRLSIGELLDYEKNSIVQIEKRIGLPMNILVNGVSIGEGTIVVQNQRFCVKITKLYEHVDKMAVITA